MSAQPCSPRPSSTGTPSTSNAPSTPSERRPQTSTPSYSSTSHRWAGSTSTSPATTPGGTRSNPEDTANSATDKPESAPENGQQSTPTPLPETRLAYSDLRFLKPPRPKQKTPGHSGRWAAGGCLGPWGTGVRMALSRADPLPRKTPVRVSPRLGPFKDAIDAMLREDMARAEEAAAHRDEDPGPARRRARGEGPVVFDGVDYVRVRRAQIDLARGAGWRRVRPAGARPRRPRWASASSG